MNKLQLLCIDMGTPLLLTDVSKKLEVEIDFTVSNDIGNVLWPTTEWIGVCGNNIFITTDDIDDFFLSQMNFSKKYYQFSLIQKFV